MFQVSRKIKPRWAMPVSLQSRAPLRCTVVESPRKRQVPQSPLGFHIRPRRLYQVQLVSQGPDDEPTRITLAAPTSLRCPAIDGEVTSLDGRPVHWLSFEPLHRESWPWYLRSLFSRVETLAVRLEYGDGRDDYEHSLPLVITPTRLWVLWSLLSVAVLYFMSSIINHLLNLDTDLPARIAYLRDLSQEPSVWLGLASIVVVPWLLVTLLDRINLWVGWRKRRN